MLKFWFMKKSKRVISLLLALVLIFPMGSGFVSAEDLTDNNAMTATVEASIEKLEAATFKADAAEAGTADTAKEKAIALVEALLEESGVEAMVNEVSFTPAATVDSPVQPNIGGKYKFTATLSGSDETQLTTGELTMFITPTPDGCLLQETIEYLCNVIGPRPSGTIAEYRACEYIKEQYEKVDGGDNVYEIGVEEYTYDWVPARGIQMNPNNLTQYGYLFMNDHQAYGVIEADVPSGAAAMGLPYPNNTGFREFELGLFYDFGTFDAVENTVSSKPAESDVLEMNGKIYGTLRFERGATGVTGAMINAAITDIKAAYKSEVDVMGLFIAANDSRKTTSNPAGYTYNDIPLSVSGYTNTTTSVTGLTLVDLEKVKAAGEAGTISKVYRIDPETGWLAYARKYAKDKDNPDLVMVYQSHIDTVRGAPGTTDTATGVAATVELARRFKDVDTGNIEIIFAATGAEEYHDFSASLHLIEKLRAEGKDVVTVDMMFDTPSSGEDATNVLGDPVDTWAIGTLQFKEEYQYPNYRNATYGDNLGTETSVFNLAAHLLASFADEIDWPVGIQNVRINNWGASDHAMWAYFGIDAVRPSSVARGGNFSISSSNTQVYGWKYHSARDNMDDYNYERHLKTTNLLANGIQKAIDLEVTKRAKFSIDETARKLTLHNANQLWQAYDRVEVSFGDEKITFTPESALTLDTPAGPLTRVMGYGEGVSNNTNPTLNPEFFTELYADYAQDDSDASLKVTAPKFLGEITGYTAAPEKAIVIENTGGRPATNVSVSVDSPNFTVVSGNDTIAWGGADESWKIGPKAGLAKGVYTAKVTVSYDQGDPVEAAVKFRVADDMLEDVVEYLSKDIGQRIYGTPNELKAAEYVAEQFKRNSNFNVEVKTVELYNNPYSQDGYMQRSYPTASGFIEIDGAPSVSGTPNPSNHATAFSSFEGLFYDFGTYDNRSGAAQPAAGLKFPDASDVAAHGGKVYGTVKFEGAPSTAHGTAVVNAIKEACGATEVTGLILARTEAGGSAPGNPQYVTSAINLTSLNISTIGVPLRYLEKVIEAGEKGKIVSVRRIVPEETYVTIATKPAATDEPDLVIVLCGHIDSYIPSPGANDDLSAIAALVELARYFDDFDTGNVELVFAAVGGEEYSGYNGSAHVAELLLEDGRRDIAINMAMDMIAAPEGAISAAGAPINSLNMGVYMGTGNTIEPAFNLSSHLVLSYAKESGIWTEGLNGINKVHLISYDASDHEMFGNFGIDSSRMVVGGDVPYTGGSRYSAMEQLYHTSQDTMEENWSYERNLMSASLMRNAVEKAIELEVTKRAKFSVSGDTLSLDNAARHFKTFDKVEAELVHKTNGTRQKVTFTKPAGSVVVPNLQDYRVNYEAVASGVGIADHTNAEMNDKYKNFATKLHAEGAAGLIEPRPSGPALTVTPPKYDPVIVGYTRPVAKTLTIENYGDAEARITNITAPSGWTIGATNANNPQQRVVSGGKQLRRTIQPPIGLPMGTHKAPVTITYDGGKVVETEVVLIVRDENEPLPDEMTFATKDKDGVWQDAKTTISLSEERSYRATVSVPEAASLADVQALIDGGLKWSLSRETGWQDYDLFPYQYLGGELSNWKLFGTDNPFFILDAPVPMQENGHYFIQLTFSNKYFFGANRIDSPSASRNAILDYTGPYDFSCAKADGTPLGTTSVRVNPYDSFRTAAEVEQELDAAVDYVSEHYAGGGMYAQKLSLGQTTHGRNMPYIIIADSPDTITKYQELKDKAEKDPVGILAELQSNPATAADYKVPVLYSNIHSNEYDGVDSILNFMWDIVKSDQTEGKVKFNRIDSFTAEGKAEFDAEMASKSTVWSELLKDEGGYWTEGLGFLNGNSSSTTSVKVDLEKYYNMAEDSINVGELFGKAFFILVPSENIDGRTYGTRQGGGGVDLNRDNLFQTQAETQNMTKMIAKWNPITFFELHGHVAGFQVEPCSPPHEPNFEYDLFAKLGLQGGEAFGIGAIANNDTYNSFQMPMRDYMRKNTAGERYWWNVWDDMSTNYTPQYSMLHGTLAFTIEIPTANEAGTRALEYGMVGHAKFVLDNKDELLANQIEFFRRGVQNIDADTVRPYYVDYNDNPGAEADIFRPKYEENNNFFPEYYVIPADGASQKNLAAAYDMQEFLVRNGVTVSTLNEDMTVTDAKGVERIVKAGSFVVDMHQAKRNVANGAMYDGVVITGWPTLYSEPITAFGKTRGFDYYTITKPGAFAAKLTAVAEPQEAVTAFTGVTDGYVIIKNSGVEAVKAVNDMLYADKKVGFITEDEDKGHFIVSYADFESIRDKFAITAKGVELAPPSYVIGKPTLYIPGRAAEFATINGQPYGVRDAGNYGNNNYNFDVISYERLMGFQLTRDVNDANIIIGNRTIGAAEEAVIKAGTPYIAAGTATLAQVKARLLPDMEYVTVSSGYDALFRATYSGDTLITKCYEDGDGIMYTYGASYISKVPQGGQAIISSTKEYPLEGFFRNVEGQLDGFLGNTMAFDYKTDSLDVTVFANTVTSKMHQQNDFRLASNAIYSKLLGEEFIHVTGFTLKAPTALGVLKTMTLEPVITPADASNKKIIWTSSNPRVATVDDAGVVKALATGSVVITGKTVDGNFERKITLKIM